ncbi:MAG TPA: hypothetical protein VI168_02725 [Croceibacterium sp.]
MARTLTPTIIPPKMYRHFALVTVLLTMAVAMFASGENRQATAAQIEERRQQEEFEQNSREKLDEPKIAHRSERRSAHFSADSEVFDRSFGRPMSVTRGGSGAAGIAAAVGAPGGAPPAYSEHYLASLGEEERKLLLEGLERERQLSNQERAQRNAALAAASGQRSGGSHASE